MRKTIEKTCQIRVSPEEVSKSEIHRELIAKKLGISESSLGEIILRKRSLDCRGRAPVYELVFDLLSLSKSQESHLPRKPQFKNVNAAPEVFVVGAGPCGLFAALRLIELGYKPIVLERGKGVRERRRDVAEVSRGNGVNEDSNYCFGLGGAGTFSDGKLYCRSVKPAFRNLILDLLVYFGSDPDILINTRPHIGTNKLPAVIEKISSYITEAGGEIRFNSKIKRLVSNTEGVRGVEMAGGEKLFGEALILATGHSAGDIFESLSQSGVLLERKPFALGVRVEHPQSLVDSLQYGTKKRGEFLPAAYYSLKTQSKNHGVYSFCMCPGGVICPASTKEGELVVNGWSPSKRNSLFANSGIVVEVSDDDLKSFGGDQISAAMNLQKEVEISAWQAGGGEFRAPAQRLSDFIFNQKSAEGLPRSSYNPGLNQCSLSDVFPDFITERLRAGFKDFSNKLPGYLSEEAIVVAPESRTSSVYRIPRDSKTLFNAQFPGLFPAGEGAGYAGGIMSAAVDGWKVADGVSEFLSGKNSV